MIAYTSATQMSVESMVEKVVNDNNVVDQIQDQRLEFHLLQILIKLKGGEIRQLFL